ARETEMDPGAPPASRARPRVYASVLIVSLASAALLIATRSPVRSTLLRTHGIPGVESAPDGSEWISNSFQWVVENQSDRSAVVGVDEEAARALVPGIEIRDPQGDAALSPGERRTRPLWIRAPRGAFADRTLDLTLQARVRSPERP